VTRLTSTRNSERGVAARFQCAVLTASSRQAWWWCEVRPSGSLETRARRAAWSPALIAPQKRPDGIDVGLNWPYWLFMYKRPEAFDLPAGRQVNGQGQKRLSACPAQAGLNTRQYQDIRAKQPRPVNQWLSVSRHHYETFHEMAEFYRMALWRRDCHVASNTHRLGYLSAGVSAPWERKRLAIRCGTGLALIGVAVVPVIAFRWTRFFARVASRNYSDRITRLENAHCLTKNDT